MPLRPLLLALALLTLAAPASADRWRKPPRVKDASVVVTRAEGEALPGGELQAAVLAARDAVLPALVHVEPVREVFQRGRRSKETLTGSGVVVDDQGHVLTNHHVAENAKRLKCVLADQREVEATLVGTDPLTDIAVLKLELPRNELPPPARLGASADLTAGQFVIALGSPLGLSRSLSLGVVSTPDRYFPENLMPGGELTGAYNTWIQTDAAINPGNSGGPLVDLSGSVIGINARAMPIFGENLGFAIPMDVVREVFAQLVRSGRVERSWIGARWQPLQGLADHFGAGGRDGVLVGGVVPGGPAAEAGLQAGDVLVAWNGQPVSARFEEELPAVRKRIADTAIGDRVRISVLRDGAEQQLRVKTQLRPDIESDEAEFPLWGLTTRDITPEIARDLQPGDVIRQVERIDVEDTAALLEQYRELRAAGVRRVLVKLDRGATLRLTVIEPEAE
jgi:serine protease Do